MKYTIAINQAGIADAGLDEKTDLIDWAILEYVKDWTLNPRATLSNGSVWINIKHMIASMPLLGIKTKSPISRRISKLAEIGLIESHQDPDKRLYVKLTEYFHDVTTFRQGVAQTGRVLPQNNGVLLQSNRGVATEQHTVVNHRLDNHNHGETENAVNPKDVVEWYNRAFEDELVRQCVSLTDARRSSINARTRELLKTPELWAKYLEAIKASDFLMGKIPPREGRKQFRLDIDWIINANNCVMIAEGKYDNDRI